MKRFFAFLTLIAAALIFTASKPVIKDCKCGDIPLFGKVQIVNTFPDFRVKIVNAFGDLNVKFTNQTPTECGEWRIVTANPDFKVKYVETFPDFKIKIVNSFPGMK